MKRVKRVCDKCGCEFSFTKKDVLNDTEEVTVKDYKDDYYILRTYLDCIKVIKCPLCGYVIRLYSYYHGDNPLDVTIIKDPYYKKNKCWW